MTGRSTNADSGARLVSPGSAAVAVQDLAAILDGLDAAVLCVDRELLIHFRNARASESLADGRDFASAFAEVCFLQNRDEIQSDVRRMFDTGSAQTYSCAVQRPGGSEPAMMTLRCTPIRSPGSESVCAVALLMVEGSDAKMVERQLEVSRRLASLGKLAARVAHELNNPLDGILRYINLALRLAGESSDSKLASYLAESRTGLMRMVQIIGDLLEFSRISDGQFAKMTVNEVVEQAIQANAEAADTQRIVVAADFRHKDMPVVYGSRLYQVCCNLIRNGIDAMPEGGRISITTGVVNGTVVIEVADSGVGLPDPPDRVFEPFYTTKPPGKGTGLGLAICRDFVEDMGGTVTASAGHPSGAALTVRIPVQSFKRVASRE